MEKVKEIVQTSPRTSGSRQKKRSLRPLTPLPDTEGQAGSSQEASTRLGTWTGSSDRWRPLGCRGGWRCQPCSGRFGNLDQVGVNERSGWLAPSCPDQWRRSGGGAKRRYFEALEDDEQEIERGVFPGAPGSQDLRKKDGKRKKKKKKEKAVEALQAILGGKKKKKKKKKNRGREGGDPSGSRPSSEEGDSYSSGGDVDSSETDKEDLLPPLKKSSEKTEGSVLSLLIERIEARLKELSGAGESSDRKVVTYWHTLIQSGAFSQQSRDGRETYLLANVIDLLRVGRLAKLGDALAARWLAIEQASLDQQWSAARHLELYSPDQTSAAGQAITLAARKFSKMMERVTQPDDDGKGRVRKGKGGKGDGGWHDAEPWWKKRKGGKDGKRGKEKEKAEAIRVFDELALLFPDTPTEFFVENVASMDVEVRGQLSEMLGVTPYPARAAKSRTRGPGSALTLVTRSGYTEVQVDGEWRDVDQWLSPGWEQVDESTIYTTFMKAIHRTRPPPKPAGLSRADSMTRRAWWEDHGFRYPPYQYRFEYLVYNPDSDQTRMLDSSEREVLMGYGFGHTCMAMSASTRDAA